MNNKINKKIMNYINRELDKYNELVILHQANLQEFLYLHDLGIKYEPVEIEQMSIVGYPVKMIYGKYTR